MSEVATAELDEDEPLVDPLGTPSEESIPFRYSITAYGADYPVDGLVKRLKDGDIYIPHFQRSYVWKPDQAIRFIESLLLGLPVPGIFLSREEETGKLLVVDGQQRLRTLQFFYDGQFPDGRQFMLAGLKSKFVGLTYETLSDEDRRRLNDSIIHATIVRQDQPSEDESSIYYIFERLNTGGTLLQPQEIRASIYHGEFNDLLGLLNDNLDWRAIYGKKSLRMRDQELILRFLGLYFEADVYEEPMKGFLNAFMARNRHLQKYSAEQCGSLFGATISTARQALGTTAFRRGRGPLNAAVVESVMVGIAKRLERGLIAEEYELSRRYDLLLQNGDYLTAIEAGTARRESVQTRLRLATETIASVK